MPEEIKQLIEKIQQEGIQAGEEKARDIEGQAKRRAEEILAQAEKQAKRLIDNAREQVAKMEQNGQASLEQSARDLLLSLRKQIDAMLEGLILRDVREALKAEELTKIIATLIKQRSGGQQENIIVSLSEKDLKKLAKGLLSGLSSEAKKGIALRASGEISAGFIISYDNGKSHYDFSDKAIAEYLSTHLKPRLAEALSGAASRGKKK